MATMPGRESQLLRTLCSLEGQADQIRVYLNKMSKPPFKFNGVTWIENWNNTDLTDNGKFWALDYIKEPEFFLTVDDDIIYGPDYVEKMVDAVKTFRSIITIHGRVLKGKGLNYYRGHKFVHCARETKKDHVLDVCGTGVTAFDTRYFHPLRLARSKYQRMSDIIFSLEAAKQKRRIVAIRKPEGWVDPQVVMTSIYSTEVKTKQETQIELCDKIYELNH